MNDSPPHSVPLLAAACLAFSRNDEPVFGPLELRVDCGEALLLQGGNGVGKTTLLRVLAGLLRPDPGARVEIDGEPATRERVAHVCALLGHLPGLKGELSTLENLRFAVGLFGQRRGSSPEAALASCGLAGYEDTPARQLSAGQRKRLSLARLLLLPARLWLLDEPYANLDLEGITLVNRMVERHLSQGGGVLITTHGAYAAPPVRQRTMLLERAA
jgi:heme exporter protein A